MANFCAKCGGKTDPDDKFCKSCGTGLTDAAQPAAAPVVRQIPASRPEPPVFIQLIRAGLQILILGLVLYWVWYSYNCAVGNHLNNGDQMCQSFYQMFSGGGGGGGGGGQVNIACQHCSPGYCWTGTACCPSSAQYYCKGLCYRSSNDAYSAGCHQSNWTRWCCSQ